ncbi:hypothetical protein ACQRCP_03925 [Streptococcus alactolyticus]|uniref:hypothetical protein n=1 Tax=Streptococcus alactolyticus TaxID=29389 RepID=UPI003D048D88
MNDYQEMTVKTYLTERLDDKINSYQKKSHFHRERRAIFIVLGLLSLRSFKSLFWL